MQVIPAVDVLDGSVVRLERGSFDAVTIYEAEPHAVLRRWVNEGADLVHVVDLHGARSGSRDARLVPLLAEYPIQIGGGIRSAADAEHLLTAGAQRVVFGTSALWDARALVEIVAVAGADRVVVSLDVRDGKARGSGWKDDGVPVSQVVDRVVQAGVSRVLVTGIDTDGTMAGPDVELFRQIRSLQPGLHVIGSGGVGGLDDLVAVAGSGAEAVIVGKALYEARFTLAEALAVVAER